MNNSIINLTNVTKRFKVGDGEFTALKNINLNFKKGEFAGFVGPSGSGKTTLLNYIYTQYKSTHKIKALLASIHNFKNYVERGEVFEQLVATPIPKSAQQEVGDDN